MSEELGDVLKQARLQKDLSLDEVQELTKIRKRYLQSIETGKLHDLPGSFYVRAFVKSYAEAVDLDPQEVLQMYKSVLPQHTPEPVIEPVKRKKRSASNSDRITKWASLFFLICFFMLIFGIIYYFLYNSDRTLDRTLDDIPLTEKLAEERREIEPDSSPNAKGEDKVDQDEDIPVLPEKPAEPEVNLVNTDNTTYVYTVSNTDQLLVEMNITGDKCWVQVKKDNGQGEDLERKMYYEDEEEVWEVPHSLWIRLGAPSATELEINGHALDHLQSGTPINLQINLVQSNQSGS